MSYAVKVGCGIFAGVDFKVFDLHEAEGSALHTGRELGNKLSESPPQKRVSLV